jgi:hypothetical protein
MWNKGRRASWQQTWRIPRRDIGSVIAVFAIFVLFFLWVGLSVSGFEAESVRAARRFLPPWFFLANLFFCPTLLALGASHLRIPGVVRVISCALMLASGSLFIVTRQHQVAGLLMLAFLYFEAFFIIPRWTRWAEARWPQTTRSWASREHE